MTYRLLMAAAAAACVATLPPARTAASAPPAAAARLTIDLTKTGPAVSPVLHGLFFEDINYGADGGLYAELVQNRSFEHGDALFAWTKVERGGGKGNLSVATSGPLNRANPRFARLDVRSAGRGVGVANGGWDGVAVRQGDNFRFSVHARAGQNYRGGLLVALEDERGRVLSQQRIAKLLPAWRQYRVMLPRAARTTDRARLVVLADALGWVDLDVVSLFPEKTWKGRENGLRADLVQKLAEMRPGFMRFPGGCIIEGRDLANAYRWKETVGDVSGRKQNWNRWQNSAPEAPAPQYYQTYGFGFFEYFQLCEDIGAAPVPVVNCGMACQFQTGELVPMEKLGPWVQDALDLVEFANGPVTSKWGRLRASMGHPKPFNMKYLAIGNEQWGEEYFKRYRVFYDALKKKHPEIVLITTSGPGVDDQWWDLAWNKFRTGTPAEIVDEHYYRAPSWFLDQVNRYDAYDRNGPKVFAGEYAAHGPGRRNTLDVALAEAAFMTGLVRNSDVVHMASYAPLLAKVGNTQWAPDLIWFDNTRVYGSPSFYVQSLFSRHKGDVVVPTTLAEPPRAFTPVRGKIGVGTWNTQAEFKDIHVTKNGQTLLASDFTNGADDWQRLSGTWEVVDGALRQTGTGTNARAFAGDAGWSDYTLSLKARKLGGREGFLIQFQAPGDLDSTSWWNVGGWNNTEHGLDVPGLAIARVPGRIETGRWYDVRVELDGPTIRCYLDDVLVQQVTRRVPKALYAVTTRDKKTGELLVKVVNASDRAMPATLDLRGAKRVAPDGTAVVLSAATPAAENSLARPRAVVPRAVPLTGLAPTFRHTFPAHSLTVLRLRASASR